MVLFCARGPCGPTYKIDYFCTKIIVCEFLNIFLIILNIVITKNSNSHYEIIFKLKIYKKSLV